MFQSAKNVLYDTVVYGATKAVSNRIDMAQLKPVNSKDIVFYAGSDMVYQYFIKGKLGASAMVTPDIDEEVKQVVFLGISVTVLNELMGRRDRVMDNLINIGLSGVVNNLVDQIVPKM